MINRIAVIIRYKKPFVDWINTSDPYEDHPEVTVKSANDDNNVYIIDDRYAENFETWLKKNFKTLFDNELNDWYTDPSLWPEKRDLRTFRKWFVVEYFTVVLDLGRGGIFDDEYFDDM